MTLPDFVVIGAMKGGTTALWQYLRHHPQVFMPEPKEVQFFSRNWDNGWGWYEERFAPAQAKIAIGEASPSYAEFLHFPEVPERIASRMPEARLIYLVRHPVERIASQYVHNLTRGFEDRSIEESLRGDNEGYIGMSRYATIIDGYLEHFRRDQLLVVQSEHLRHDRDASLQRIMEFIGIDPTMRNQQMTHDFYRADQKPKALKRTAVLTRTPSRSGRLRVQALARVAPSRFERRYERLSEMSDELRTELTDTIRPEVARLRMYLDESFDGWGIA